MLADQEKLSFNGINGATGSYLLPELTPGELFAAARGETPDRDHLNDLKLRLRQSGGATRAVKEGVDPLQLSQAGWGVIFAFDEQDQLPAVREALTELLDLRQSQSGERYREFTCRPGESKTAFLARHGAGPGPADPLKVPYYLLIVASPQAIPFDFQYQLDVQYAVGRLHFDNLEDYASYARSVVAAERGETVLSRQAAFFGVQNDDDRATQMSAEHLVGPLSQSLTAEPVPGWEIRSITGSAATKSSLEQHLGGESTPALLFTASHGMGFPKDDTRQLPHQGALLCQDWPGPYAWKQPIPEEHYFSADDLASDARLSGGMSFHYACYGAGTPEMDDFAHRLSQAQAVIAPHSFVARLPQRLLSHSKGGLQAIIGHVERAWGYSFSWRNAGSQLAVFESTLKRLMAGSPVGYAMEFFNARYAELSTVISSEMLGVQLGKQVDEAELAGMWTANNDARSYVILGDPAVRLHLLPASDVAIEQPAAESVTLQSESPSPEDDLTYILGDFSPAGRRDALEGTIQALQKTPSDGGETARLELLARLSDLLASSPSSDRASNLQAAILACQAALRHATAELESSLLSRLGEYYAALYELSGQAEHAREAQAAFTEAVILLQTPDATSELASVQFSLACLCSRQHSQDQDPAIADRARKYFHLAIESTSAQDAPYQWASIHFELAKLENQLFAGDENEQHRASAIESLQAALHVFSPDLFPHQHTQAQSLLAGLE